jgi:hypothetical protein
MGFRIIARKPDGPLWSDAEYFGLLRGCRAGARANPSQRDRFSENAGANTLLQSTLSDNIHAATKQLSKLNDKTAHIQQTSAWFHVYEEIDVAIGPRFSTRNRSEDTNVGCAILASDLQHLLAICFEDIHDFHALNLILSDRACGSCHSTLLALL